MTSIMLPSNLRQMFSPGQSIGTQASPEELRQRMLQAQQGLRGMTPPSPEMQNLAVQEQAKYDAFRQDKMRGMNDAQRRVFEQAQALGSGVDPIAVAYGGEGALGQAQRMVQMQAQQASAPQQLSFTRLDPSTMPVLKQQPQGVGQGVPMQGGGNIAYSKAPASPQPILQQGAMPGRAMPPMAQGRPMGQPMGGMRPAAKPVAPPMQARPMGGARPMVKSAPPPQPARPMGGARPAVKAPAPAPMGRGPAAPRRYK
jgi:hypothetical protein